MIWHVIWMLILGLIVGAIARFIVPGKHDMGLILTALLGIVGGYVGGTLGSVVFPPARIHGHPTDQSFLPRRPRWGSDPVAGLRLH
jgi:uncharacterized membrane protein YeaQ/YmgE (transglycosylase-associated protein family)